MPRNITLRLVALFVLAAVVPVFRLAAQETQNAPSVAEAARRAKQNKEAASKPAQVITNDTMPSAPDAANGAVNPNPGATPPNSNASAAAAAADDNSGEGTSEEARKKAEIESLKKEIAEKQQSVNVLQREIALEQDTLYSKPDYQRDTASKQKLDSLQSDLKTQQDELAKLKARMVELAGAEAAKEPVPAKPPAAATPPQS